MYSHDSNHEDGADSELSVGWELQLKYRLDGYHEQIHVAQSTEDALNDCKALRRTGAFLGARQPCSKITWLAWTRHAQRTVADYTGGVKQPAHDDAAVDEPASDLVGFENPEVKEEQGQFDKKGRRGIQIDGSQCSLISYTPDQLPFGHPIFQIAYLEKAFCEACDSDIPYVRSEPFPRSHHWKSLVS